MANFLEDVGRHFESLASTHEILVNFGATQFVDGTNLFYVIEPPTPTDCVTLIPYGGAPPDTGHRFAQYPSMQVRVKADGVAKGYKVTQSVINELHQNVSLGSDIPMACFAQQSAPLFLEFDDEDYPVFVCNFDFMIRKHSVS